MLARSATCAVLILLASSCSKKQDDQEEKYRRAPEVMGTNWDGEPFKLSQTYGKVTALVFGYTFCPDVCPFTLARMRQMYAELGDDADQAAVVFVSVDPERDTVKKLSQYVPAFDKRFYGVNVKGDALHAAVHAYHLRVRKGQSLGDPEAEDQYAVDHTGTIFLIGKDGRIHYEHPHDASVDTLLNDVRSLLKEGT